VLQFRNFIIGSARTVFRGNKFYFAWLALLGAMIAVGVFGYVRQMHHGLIVTNMRDQVSWAFYIGNFTFLVGVAAAAVVLVIPAYVYNWKPIKEISVIGELLAVAAIIMCLLFVVVDIGRPDRAWHLLPIIGLWNAKSSVLAWDVLVLNLYFVVNFVVATHIVYRAWTGRHYSKRFATPLILFSIPLAVSIHTVTAFVYNGQPARPYWNSAILAPRFLASAFCSGPAIMLVCLQVLRKYSGLVIRKEALWKIAELMAYAMFINLFLFCAEIFTEYYSNTTHLVHSHFAWFGLEGHNGVMPWSWVSIIFAVVSFLIFLNPKTRKNPILLNVGIGLIFVSVFIEKGMGLVIPGFTPTTLGDIYDYVPSATEVMVAAGIYGIGFFAFTAMAKVATAVMKGELLATGAVAPNDAP